MNYKLIIGGVVGLILIGGGFSLISSMMAKNAPTSGAVVIGEREFQQREQREANDTSTTVTPRAPEEPIEEEPVAEEPLDEGLTNESGRYVMPDTEPVQPTEETPEDGIKKAFMDKYGRPESEVSVTITQSTDNHAKGGIKFGAGGVGEGGLFLATKISGVWTLVFDGNGTVSCAELAPYGFPQEMIGEMCF